jgi:hypothetical protein
MRSPRLAITGLAIVGLVGDGGATGAPDAPATSSPYAAAKLQGWAHTLREAADGFTAGAQQKLEVNKAWLQSVFQVSKEACTMGTDLLAWHDQQPPAAWSAIYDCLTHGDGAWTDACDLKRNLELSIGCGGSNGPAYCYEGFADAAVQSARSLDAWAACVNIGLTAQAQSDAAEKAQAQADAAAQNGSGQPSGSGSGQQSGSGSNQPGGSKPADRDAEEKAKRDEAKREEAKRERDSHMHAVYDAKTAEIERRNRIADRWQKGVQQQQELLAQQQQGQIDLVSSLKSGGNDAAGASWRVHAFLGGGGLLFPVYTDATGADINSFSTVELAGGMGFDGSLELWPYFGPHVGIGAVVEAVMGWHPNVNGSALAYEGYLAARGFAGADGRGALLFEAGRAWRNGAASGDIGAGVVDAYSTGTASYQVTRVGLGGRLCGSQQYDDARFCKFGFDALLFLDQVGFEHAGGTPFVGRLTMWWRGALLASIDLGFGYPAAGTPKYAPEHTDGVFALFHVDKGWDWFGDPYGETAAQRQKRLDRNKSSKAIE